MESPPSVSGLEGVIGEARKRVSAIVGRHEVEEFCIGRTDDPDAARRQKDCDEMVVLYETEKADEARVVADALTKAFLGLQKCSNKGEQAEESSFGGRKNYVCLAVWNREAPTW